MQILSRLFGTSFEAQIEPDEPFVAIGDIHGRADLLEQVLRNSPENCPLVFVGDYVDRGNKSATVIRRLKDLSQHRYCHFLMGNHERMLLDFIDNPVVSGPRWLRFGGLQTLESFQVHVPRPEPEPDALQGIADALREAMGAELLQWVQTLPLSWASGNVRVVHAAADPAATWEAQTDQSMLWGHKDFRRKVRKDGLWVVHGHTIVGDAVATRGVISIDTGAYATGRLTAARISRDGVQFQST